MGESDDSKLTQTGDPSQLFRIEQSEDKGRYLVATRDIKPLELIIRFTLFFLLKGFISLFAETPRVLWVRPQ